MRALEVSLAKLDSGNPEKLQAERLSTAIPTWEFDDLRLNTQTDHTGPHTRAHSVTMCHTLSLLSTIHALSRHFHPFSATSGRKHPQEKQVSHPVED